MSASAGETSAHDVRKAATEILVKVETRKAYSDVLLDSVLNSSGLSHRDRALLTELTYGTLRWRGRIDACLQQLVRRPLVTAEPFLRNLLRIAVYQLTFLDAVPDYAAVNTAVELAKLHGGRHAAAFVNAVLRSYLRHKQTQPWPEPGSDTAALAKIAEYWSHPQWLVEQWRNYLGAADLVSLLAANNEEAPLVVRANALTTSREILIEKLQQHGVDAAPTRWSPQGIRVKSNVSINQLPGFTDGLFQVQGEASQLVTYLLAPQPGERILDACAAPGGKTTHIAEFMQDTGEIVATDISHRGLRKLDDNAKRLHLSSIRTVVADASRAVCNDLSPFDRVLVDAPCSGFGTLRSHPEIKWNRNEADIDRLSRLQQRILTRAAAQLKPGGILVYSTCTLTRRENEQAVQNFLEIYKNFISEDAVAYLPEPARNLLRDRYLLALPHRHDTDGFFAARLRKVET